MFMVAGTRIKTVVGSILRQREVCDRGVSSKTDLPSGVVILFNLGFVSPGWGNRQPLLTQRLTHHKHTTRIEGTIVCQRNAIVSTYFCPVSTFFFAFPSLSRFNELTCSGECDESWVTCSWRSSESSRHHCISLLRIFHNLLGWSGLFPLRRTSRPVLLPRKYSPFLLMAAAHLKKQTGLLNIMWVNFVMDIIWWRSIFA